MYVRMYVLCMYAAMIVWDYSTHKPEIIRSCIFISLLGSGKLRGREAGPSSDYLIIAQYGISAQGRVFLKNE